MDSRSFAKVVYLRSPSSSNSSVRLSGGRRRDERDLGCSRPDFAEFLRLLVHEQPVVSQESLERLRTPRSSMGVRKSSKSSVEVSRVLDAHCFYNASGSSSISAFATADIPSGDGATAAGVPISPNATLIAFGAATITSDDEITELKLTANDLNDAVNGLDIVSGGTPTTIISKTYLMQLPYATAARSLSYKQADADKVMGWLIDHYDFQGDNKRTLSPGMGTRVPNANFYSQVFGGALTAGVYKTQVLAPTNAIPFGTYEIMGAKVSALTNVGFIRFLHSNFGSFTPGFPVVDLETTTLTMANISSDRLYTDEIGSQFVYLSEVTKRAQCPRFTCTPNGSGLSLQMLSLNADTPQVDVFLNKVG